ncbi:GDSL-type esterase/lipase family protein [Enterococcus sp. RIT-PI-f]|uniref:GDSL-type esterase/lipase family protein n=1 Tax=Enterococcus sp. RIT-PI-f TaxID=1690244 RepID=UPI0006B8BD52|nr:GDSL-type esterase/lipase family protein [Enterococcus sp. RIT-PI-f]KPG69563.1 hypothetical protein AEQ18_12740 [Enterococcus sp. RIT-PI-f]
MADLNSYFRKNEYAEKGKIVFAGSSLMEEFPLEKLFMDQHMIVYNRGISGATSKEYLEVFDQLIFPLDPTHLFINIGSNDLADKYFDINSLLGSYRQIFSKLKKTLPQCKVTFIMFYPVNTEKIKETARHFNEEWLFQAALYRTNERLIEASEKVSELADLYDFDTVTVNSLLMDNFSQLDASFTNDGIHLTEAAYLKIFPMIYHHVVQI